MRILYEEDNELICREIYSIESKLNSLKVSILTETIMYHEIRLQHLNFIIDDIYNPKELIKQCFETGILNLCGRAELVFFDD